MLQQIRRLYEHLWWADRRILNALAPEQASPQCSKLLAHLVAAEAIWLARLRGGSAPLPVWPSLSITDCASLLDQNSAGFSQYLGSLSDAELRQSIAYRNSAGTEFCTPVAEILVHVALHGSYHRGQLAAELRRGGVQPPSMDYIEFVRDAPAAARDSE